jgi:hypothetical protein
MPPSAAPSLIFTGGRSSRSQQRPACCPCPIESPETTLPKTGRESVPRASKCGSGLDHLLLHWHSLPIRTDLIMPLATQDRYRQGKRRRPLRIQHQVQQETIGSELIALCCRLRKARMPTDTCRPDRSSGSQAMLDLMHSAEGIASACSTT